MTMREVLNRKKRTVTLVTWSCFAIFGVSGYLSRRFEPLFPVALVAFGVAFVTILLALFGIRCSRCRGNLGYLVAYSGGPMSVGRAVKYCPYCGVQIDESVDSIAKQPNNALQPPQGRAASLLKAWWRGPGG